jgi:hypothetical protein
MANQVSQLAALVAHMAFMLPVFGAAAKDSADPTGTLYAMRPPEEYRAARAAATHWLQVRIIGVTQPDRLPGVCVVRGEVLRTFRGAAPATKTIDLEVECKKRGERSPPGDEFRIEVEDLVAGKHLEAFAEARGARYAVVARQVELIAKPGDKPTFSGKE